MLLIACGNAAALLLVRGLQRQQEYAVRSALGISRAGLFRQVSTESLVLALLGGVVGMALAFGIVQVFKLIGGHAIPRLDAVTTRVAGAGCAARRGAWWRRCWPGSSRRCALARWIRSRC